MKNNCENAVHFLTKKKKKKINAHDALWYFKSNEHYAWIIFDNFMEVN